MNLDILEIWIAIGLSILIGLWASFKTFKIKQTLSEYFLAWGLLDKKRIFFSVFATTFSAFTVVGLPAMFYANGIGAYIFMGVGIILTPFTLHFIGRKIIALSQQNIGKFTSPVGLLTSSYNSKALTIILSLTTIVVLFPYLILQIAGIGKFLVSISDGNISYVWGTILCCLIVGIYIYSGGAKADAETDLIQGILLIIGTLVVGIILLILISKSDFISPLNDKGLLSIPGPKNYFSIPLLFSYGVIFTLISISTPQVSQKIMGIKNEEDLKPLIKYYWIVGLIILFFAGLIGLYAAVHLKVASPDFVTGDVLRTLKTAFSGNIYPAIFFIVSILFISGVISAAVSTIDSLLLAVTGIVSDNVPNENKTGNKPTYKIFTAVVLILGIILAAKPPLFIVTLAQIQLAGLTALLPCLLGPLFGINNKISGWLAIILGLTPVLANKFLDIKYFGIETGVVGMVMGIIGLLIGKLITKGNK